MIRGNSLMLGLGLTAFIGGCGALASSGRGSEGQRIARRIGGTMGAALGLVLMIFSEFAHA